MAVYQTDSEALRDSDFIATLYLFLFLLAVTLSY